MNKALGLIGIARRAGKLGIGYEVCSIAVRDGVARAICTAKDAPQRTLSWADEIDVPHIPLDVTKEELGNLLGRASCAQLVILDTGIAASVAEKLAQSDEKYVEARDELMTLYARQKRRKAKKNSRKG